MHILINLKHVTMEWQCMYERFDDTKGVIRSCKSKKDIQCNDQREKIKFTNTDLQNTTNKTKDWATRILSSLI